MEYAAFEQVFGPITPHERLDFAAALIAWAAQASQGGTASVEDFVPDWGGPSQQTPEQMIAVLRGMKKRGEPK